MRNYAVEELKSKMQIETSGNLNRLAYVGVNEMDCGRADEKNGETGKAGTPEEKKTQEKTKTKEVPKQIDQMIGEIPKRRTMTEAGFGLPSAKRHRHEQQSRIKTTSHANIRGVRSKGQQLSKYIEEVVPDVMGICETHCVKNEDLPRITGYEWVSSPGRKEVQVLEFLLTRKLKSK
ncbi:unnamed protein product [Blepharisma stoltei]|uniref:Uncharacterized protein n=1 Tax=Blepharisma stoltei TaxID=1481888 RepID=A0AAU9KFQ4_9CILI|nr:unnamed protein product [Blepharisma stoltei]